MARDLTPPPKRTAAELDALAAITPDDLLHAQETANRLATPALEQMLNATLEENPSGDRAGPP